MPELIMYIIAASIVSLVVGIVIGRVMLQKVFAKLETEAADKAKLILKEAELKAETTKRDKQLEAKEHFLKLRTEFEEDSNKKKNLIIQNEQKIKQREQSISKQLETNQRREAELDSLRENLSAQLDILNKRKEELEKLRGSQIEKLEKIANLTGEEAKEQLMETIKEEARSEASSYIKRISDEAKMTATKDAKKIVIETLQRTATENAVENCVSIFNIDSDDIKGKIIGREGRNIRALEAATGVEIIVDDTPEAIIISGFDPVRREVARLSLHRLVQDGRIHPAR
ncbi:MAG: DUF3552 domain-containing protein, partial [Cytophagales bacterium]|nr:DUF3552 domain-containing protein [Cytophaga sp.]